MKILRKTLSILLSAVIAVTALIVCPVTAGADYDLDHIYVDGFYNTAGQYCVRVGKWGDAVYSATCKALIDNGSEPAYMNYILWVRVTDQITLSAMVKFDKNKKQSVIAMISYDGNNSFKTDTSVISSARSYFNSQDDDGIVFFLPKTSSLINTLKECKSAKVTSMIYAAGDYASLQDFSEISVNTAFSFEPVNEVKDISSLSISEVTDKVYTGKKIRPSVKIKDGDYTLKKDTDYTVTYGNNKEIGYGSITLKGIGKYSGMSVILFAIDPPRTTLSVKKNSSGKFRLSWKAVDGVSKYQIRYSEDGGKTFKKAGNVSGKKTSCTLKLEAGKSYVFRIRSAVEAENSKTVFYSEWSKAVKA